MSFAYMRLVVSRARRPAVFAGFVAAAWFAVTPGARADLTTPHPGLKLVRQPGRAMIVADLCAAGVSVRATKYAERKATPQGWATPLGVKAAVNADFFDFPGATHVNGRARGGGEDWPADRQFVEFNVLNEVRHYFQFGPGSSELISPSTQAPSSAATEIVGAHNVIIRDGKSLAPGFDGDGVVLNAYRRTSIGLSKDRSKLYLFASDGALSGAAMASAVFAMSAEANGGVPDVDVASNEDGGGSSQLYVAGQGQLVTSGRLVANHLGVFAEGSGPSPQCPSKAPIGNVDAIDCENASGWTQDPDAPTKPIDVALSFDGIFPDPKTKIVRGRADIDRADLVAAVGSANHGFLVPTPYGIWDGVEHPVWGFGLDAGSVRNGLLGGEKRVTCAPKIPASKKRHIIDPTVYGAWGFDGFADRLPDVDDALVTPLPSGDPISAAPQLVRGDDGSPEVYWKDGATRRHVTSAKSAQAWHFDLAKVEVRPAAEIKALLEGPPLRFRPMLVKAKGAPEQYLLDALPEEKAPTGQGGGFPADAGELGNGAAPEEEGDFEPGCRTSRAPASSVLSLLVPLALLYSRRRRR